MLQNFEILDNDSRELLKRLSADKHITVSRDYIMNCANNIPFQKLSVIIQNLVEEKYLIPNTNDYDLTYKALYYEELYTEFKKYDDYYKNKLPKEIALYSSIVSAIISAIFYFITSCLG